MKACKKIVTASNRYTGRRPDVTVTAVSPSGSKALVTVPYYTRPIEFYRQGSGRYYNAHSGLDLPRQSEWVEVTA